MKTLLLPLLLLCASGSLFAQFDTIAGPFRNLSSMSTDGERIYALVIDNFGPWTVRAFDVNDRSAPSQLLFEDTFGNVVSDVYVMGEDLYIAAMGASLASGGFVYRVSGINSDAPTTEVLLEIPLIPTQIAVRDSVMYISQGGAFSIANIYAYDMRDPGSEPTILLEVGSTLATGLAIYEDDLIITSVGNSNASNRLSVHRIDLTSPTPQAIPFIRGLDSPGGILVEDDLLYVAERNNFNNSSSGVYVYSANTPSQAPIDILAEGTRLAIIDVERIAGSTYVSEIPLEFGEGGYILRLSEPVSTSPEFTVAEYEVFPNPTTGLVTFQGGSPERVEVLDATGKTVRNWKNADSGLTLSGLPAGVYTLLLEFGDGELGRSRVVVR